MLNWEKIQQQQPVGQYSVKDGHVSSSVEQWHALLLASKSRAVEMQLAPTQRRAGAKFSKLNISKRVFVMNDITLVVVE